MCISPREMTTQQLEQEIAALYRWAASEDSSQGKWYKARAVNLEKILKERAEAGTY